MATSTPNRTGQEAEPEARPLTSVVNDAIKTALLAVQDYSVLSWKSVVDIFSPPFYFRDLLDQIDVIGVGSLPIIMLTGFFIGAILVLQTAAQFARFGTTALTGDAVSLALIKELGPKSLPDEEAADLLRYQQAYQAAAQCVNTARTVFDSLISAVR